MKLPSQLLVFAGALAAWSQAASAQTNFVVVTNYVTVTVTNVVFITNAVPAHVAAVPPVVLPVPVVAAPEKPKSAWKQSVSAGLTLVRGNTDTTLMAADYTAEKKTPKNEFLGAAGVAYGEQNSVQTVDSYKASFQWNHFISERWYDYQRADGLRDYIADVDYRLTVGAGMGYYALKETNTTLGLEFGANYEAQDLAGQDNTFATIRLADRFEHKFSENARLWQTVEIFPQVDRFDNYVVNFEIGVEASVWKSFSLKACLDDNYDNRPAAGHLKNDLKLITGVGYKF